MALLHLTNKNIFFKKVQRRKQENEEKKKNPCKKKMSEDKYRVCLNSLYTL